MGNIIEQARQGSRYFYGESLTGYRSAFGKVDFSDCRIIGCEFINCNLEGANFGFAELRNVIFRTCQLRRADFEECVLKDVKFIRCGLGGTEWYAANIVNVSFQGSNLAAAQLGLASHVVGLENKENLEGAKYNSHTYWPKKGWRTLNPDKYGAVKVSDSDEEEW